MRSHPIKTYGFFYDKRLSDLQSSAYYVKNTVLAGARDLSQEVEYGEFESRVGGFSPPDDRVRS